MDARHGGSFGATVRWIAETTPAAQIGVLHATHIQNIKGGFYENGAELPASVYLLLLMYYEGSRLPGCPFPALTQVEIAGHMQRSKSWVSKCVLRMNNTGVCGPLTRRGADNGQSNLGAEERAALRVIIERSPSKSHRSIALDLAIACGPQAWISTETVRKEIASLGLVPVVPERAARQRFTLEVQTHTLAFLDLIGDIDPSVICNFDSSQYWSGSGVLKRAYAYRGGRCIIADEDWERSPPKYMVQAMLDVGGVFAIDNLKLGDGVTVDTDYLNDYFTDALRVAAARGNKVLLIDNAPVHDEMWITFQAAAFGIRVIFLPPYSPMYAPIELVWAWTKGQIKHMRAEYCTDMENAIVRLLQQVTPALALGFFTKSRVFAF